MRLGWQIKYITIILLCLVIFFFCSNIVVNQMNGIIGIELPKPFFLEFNPEENTIIIGIMGFDLAINQEYIKNTYSLTQEYIQNFASEVEYNLVPRVKYGADLFIRGMIQMMNDLDQIYNNIR